MLISNRQFSGERPKKSIRNIGQNEAAIAIDCTIVSDELRSMMTNRFEASSPIEDAQTLFFTEGEWIAFEGVVEAIINNSVNTGERRIFWTEEGSFPRQATIEQFQFGTFFRMGVPKPAAPTNPVVSGTGVNNSTAITSFYVVSFVNGFGEEGDRSDPSPSFDYELGQDVSISGLGNVPANTGLIDDHNIVAYRLYRQEEGSSRFVAEVPVSTTTFSENTATTVLGEAFSREDFFPPPIDMQGLHMMANGVAAGFSGTTVYLSEAFLPNAWPYSFEVEFDIVALSSFDNNLVVLTTGYPEVATILDPINVSSSQLADREPCISTRSVVEGAGGVIYAAPSGLYYIGARGGQMLTDGYLDDSDWKRYEPQSFNSVFRDGEYIAFHESTEVEGSAWIFDTREQNAVITQTTDITTAPFVLEGTDELYLVNGANIDLYQGGETRRTYLWRSKMHGPGSPFAIDTCRLLSCDFAENPTPDNVDGFNALVEEIEAENRANFDIWLNLPDIYGFGGELNTFIFGGCGLQDIPGGPSGVDIGSIFSSGQIGNSRRIPNQIPLFSTRISIYGDKELIDVIDISSDEPERVEYSDRRRLWQYDLKGNADITQVDLAGSMGELHGGS